MMFRTMRLLAPEGVDAPVVAAPVAPVATVTAPVVTTADLPPEALSKRLEQAKHAAQTELLASWGVTDPAQVKAYIDSAKAAEDAKKTIETRLAEQGLRLTASEEGLSAAVDLFSALITPEQKAAVTAIAGTDKTLWLKTYRAMAPTWAAVAPVIVATSPAASPATASPVGTPPIPPAPPVGTPPIPPAPPPNGATPNSPPNHKENYQRLQKENPFAASRYLDRHGDACFK
jgi:hypothetical protein